MRPTAEMYESLTIAYAHFNQALFDGALPEVIFTVQRRKGVMGYFAPHRWGRLDGAQCHEIAINPSYIAHSRLVEIMQTLVHEMVHCWQHTFGSPSRSQYHNLEWAKKMIYVGLMPSSTGEPGGAITGQFMADYIIDQGRFIKSFEDLKESKTFQLRWIDTRALPRLFDPIVVAHDQIDSMLDPDCTVETLNATPGVVISADQDVAELKLKQTSPYIPPNSEQRFSDLLPSGFVTTELPVKTSRHRYVCHGCNVKVYGKPNLNIGCLDCDLQFEEEYS